MQYRTEAGQLHEDSLAPASAAALALGGSASAASLQALLEGIGNSQLELARLALRARGDVDSEVDVNLRHADAGRTLERQDRPSLLNCMLHINEHENDKNLRDLVLSVQPQHEVNMELVDGLCDGLVKILELDEKLLDTLVNSEEALQPLCTGNFLVR